MNELAMIRQSFKFNPSRLEKAKQEEREWLLKEQERKEQFEKQKEKERIQEYFDSVPKRYKEACFEKFIGCEKERKQVEMLTGGILYGKNGNGKTYLGYSACRRVVLAGGTAKLIRAYDLFIEVKNEYSNPENVGKTIEKYAAYDFLVLDECDKMHGSQTEYLALASLITKRYDEDRPTLVISNANTKQEVASFLSISCLDKLRVGEDIPMPYESKRGKAQQIEILKRQACLKRFSIEK